MYIQLGISNFGLVVSIIVFLSFKYHTLAYFKRVNTTTDDDDDDVGPQFFCYAKLKGSLTLQSSVGALVSIAFVASEHLYQFQPIFFIVKNNFVNA